MNEPEEREGVGLIKMKTIKDIVESLKLQGVQAEHLQAGTWTTLVSFFDLTGTIVIFS
ncbi:hypothetical protein [Halalkalibacterium halodurans]|uniref:hypothetical protein n=1 Tax=Halalkalibacterium halodurans TaxID=86665 RepID=UPI000B055D5E|nr:hypothetical protein [Halalkalibacterium halodurans]MED4125616.1 hypothetical protein [Halalkalibacterium halodurans]